MTSHIYRGVQHDPSKAEKQEPAAFGTYRGVSWNRSNEKSVTEREKDLLWRGTRYTK